MRMPKEVVTCAHVTSSLYKASPWPEAEDVAPYVNDDPIFLNLYRCNVNFLTDVFDILI